MKDSIKKEKMFNHSIDSVWNAITNAEELSSWFIKADFKAEKGYQYTFTSNEEGCVPIIGEVKKADPYTLVYTWIVEGTNVETTVSWTLETVAEGTKLYLEHTGISMYEGENAVTMFDSFNGGWDNCTNKLQSYLKENVHAR
ncbi:SRPBCC family protein [Kordia sp.]|uniref:SRPBCC family protein n=1 Tax=Kordia sp. TaxID=1965332 RepID=UPI003B5B6D57